MATTPSTGNSKDWFKLGLKDFGPAMLAAAVIGVLAYFWDHSGPVLASWWFWAAVFLFAVGVFLVDNLTDSKPLAVLAVLAFLACTIVFVVASSSAHVVEVIEYSSVQWDHLFSQATSEISAEGMVLDSLNVENLVGPLERSNRLKVNMVILDPESALVIQRSQDESPSAQHENKVRIKEKIRAFQVAETKPGSDLWKGRFQLLVRDTYPTMAVIVVDDDLYVYFYSFRKKGTESPVFKFKNYRHSGPFAQFFEDHLRNSLDPTQGAHQPLDYTKGPITN